MNKLPKIRVAIAGIGNVASALIQSVEMAKSKEPSTIPGLTQYVAGFDVRDIEFVVGFDIDTRKTNKSLDKAIFSPPNNAHFLYKPTNVLGKTLRGPLKDGVAPECSSLVLVDQNDKHIEVFSILKEYNVDVLCIAVPAGALEAAKHYAAEGIKAGCAIMNGTSNPIANDETLTNLAIANSVPIIGDDTKSQIGATIVHRALIKLFKQRNSVVQSTLQLDWGGDMDFANMVLGKRYDLGKRESKTQSVFSELIDLPIDNCRVSAVEYFPPMKNTKDAYIRINGVIFGGAPIKIELKMEVEDAYNAAGMLVDAIRILHYEKLLGVGGTLNLPCSFFCKLPPEQLDDDETTNKLKSKYNFLVSV